MSRFKILFTALSALVLTLGAVQPAAALTSKEKQTLGLMLGIGAVAVLADQANGQGARGHGQVAPRPVHDPRGWNNGRHDTRDWNNGRYDDRGRHGRDWNDRGWGGRDSRVTVPGQCAETVRMRNGYSTVVGKHCADRNTRARLPQACAFDIRDRGRTRAVYGANCLADRGIRISRH